MTHPVLAVVEGDARVREALERVLSRRFGADYRVLTAASGEQALERLSAGGIEVALVLAAQWLSGMTGIELLARVRDLHPAARRVLLISFGDASAAAPILEAMTFGRIHHYLPKEWASPEERLYPAVGEALSEWARANRPRFEAVRVVGEEWSARAHALRDLLERNSVPYGFYGAQSPDGERLLRGAGLDATRLPVLSLHDGRVLVDPPLAELAQALGARTEPAPDPYDLAVVGGGPAGLAAAVYGASEGLRTVVIEPVAIGGQAGTSALIRNYLGFSRGVSGAELARRAYEQAWLFGTDFVFVREATGLQERGRERIVTTAGVERRGGEASTPVVARSVVVATGVSYRRLEIESLESLSGAGVFYGAATSEAAAMRGREVFVVGGGNSAGQAALHLARFAAHVCLIVRGASLDASMSDYLVREIATTSNLTVRLRARIVGGGGARRLERLELQEEASGGRTEVAADALFVLIGAHPRTGWLAPSIARDDEGYLLTGRDTPAGAWPLPRAALANETSLPGVFAAGDVRHGCMKRVASAVGDGAVAVAQIHEYLSLGA